MNFLVQTVPPQHVQSTKYIRKQVLPSGALDSIRWSINRFLLYRPFFFAAQCNMPFYSNEYIYLLTIGELAFWIICGLFVLTGFIRGVSGGGEDSAEAVGSMSEELFAIAWFAAQRNTLWNLLFGLSFERCVVFHKYLGRAAIILALAHGYGLWDECENEGGGDSEDGGESEGGGKWLTGVIATVLALALFITSIDIIRRQIFNFFIIWHWLLLGPFVWYCYKHGAKKVLFPCIITLIDIAIRVYYNFAQKVKVLNAKILSSNVLRIEFDKANFQYEAGQYVFICIPAISFWEWHPFSLSTHPHDKTVMIHIRVLGNWTKKLHNLISCNNVPNEDWNNLMVFIEGAYGSLNVPLKNYSNITLISGGIGITPMQSIFNDLITNIKDGGNKLKLKKLHFIWTVRDPHMLQEFGKRHLHWAAVNYNDLNKQSQNQVTLQEEPDTNDANDVNDENEQRSQELLDDFRLPSFFTPDLLSVTDLDGTETSMIGGVEVVTHFYLTRVKDEERQNQFSQKFTFIKFGRPNIEQIIQQTKCMDTCYDCINARGYGSAVLSCGPMSMLKDVKKYTAKHRVDCHTEIFDF